MKHEFDLKFEEMRQIFSGLEQRDCPICNLSFPNEDWLQKHMANEHKMRAIRKPGTCPNTVL